MGIIENTLIELGYIDTLKKMMNLKNETILELNKKRVQDQNERLMKGINFELCVIYNTYPGDNKPKKVDWIPLEGFENANLIFSKYRRLAFKLNLYSITLTLDDKKIKKVTFKK